MLSSLRKKAPTSRKVHQEPKKDEIIKTETDNNGKTVNTYKSGLVVKIPTVKPITAWAETTQGGKKKKASKPKATKKK